MLNQQLRLRIDYFATLKMFRTLVAIHKPWKENYSRTNLNEEPTCNNQAEMER